MPQLHAIAILPKKLPATFYRIIKLFK